MPAMYGEALRQDLRLAAALRAVEANRSQPAPSGATAHVCWMPGLHVLVVESDRDLAELIRHNLAAEGAGVQAAGTLAEGCRAVRRYGAPDAILLDIALPGVNPYDALMVLRAVCRRHVPVGFLSRSRRPMARFVGCPVRGAPFTRIDLAAFLDRILLPSAMPRAVGVKMTTLA